MFFQTKTRVKVATPFKFEVKIGIYISKFEVQFNEIESFGYKLIKLEF